MEDKFEEGVKKGMDLGREEGYTVAKEGFDSIVKRLKAREASKNTSSINSGTQTDPAATTTSGSAQTNTSTAFLHLTASISTQTSPWIPENANKIIFSPKKLSPAEVNKNQQTQMAKRFFDEPTTSYDSPSIQNESSSLEITPNNHSLPFDTSQSLEDKKSVILGVISESQRPTAIYGSPSPAKSVAAFETALETHGFAQKCPKTFRTPGIARCPRIAAFSSRTWTLGTYLRYHSINSMQFYSEMLKNAKISGFHEISHLRLL